MSRNEIYNLLRASGIKYHSRSYQDYEYAKRLLLNEPLSQAGVPPQADDHHGLPGNLTFKSYQYHREDMTMLIELSKIHPSPKPIRSSWEEEAMKNLSWSLREEGQVEPIGVHENGSGYVIVWGHRRVEAARRAQWTEIDAVVVPTDEVNNLIQAGIENLASEDMSADDKAGWAQRLTELGLSQGEISRRSTVPAQTISQWLIYKHEKDAGIRMRISKDTIDDGIRRIVDIKTVLGNDAEAKKAVANKASDDKLTTLQTRAVAEAYRDAPTPEVKAQVLKTPIISRDTSADILRRPSSTLVDQGMKSRRRNERLG